MALSIPFTVDVCECSIIKIHIFSASLASDIIWESWWCCTGNWRLRSSSLLQKGIHSGLEKKGKRGVSLLWCFFVVYPLRSGIATSLMLLLSRGLIERREIEQGCQGQWLLEEALFCFRLLHVSVWLLCNEERDMWLLYKSLSFTCTSLFPLLYYCSSSIPLLFLQSLGV